MRDLAVGVRDYDLSNSRFEKQPEMPSADRKTWRDYMKEAGKGVLDVPVFALGTVLAGAGIATIPFGILGHIVWAANYDEPVNKRGWDYEEECLQEAWVVPKGFFWMSGECFRYVFGLPSRDFDLPGVREESELEELTVPAEMHV